MTVRKAARAGVGVLVATLPGGHLSAEEFVVDQTGHDGASTPRVGFRTDVRVRYRGSEASGSFAVVKSSSKDRWIGDRRRGNAKNFVIGCARLPQICQMRRVRLGAKDIIRVTLRDGRSY